MVCGTSHILWNVMYGCVYVQYIVLFSITYYSKVYCRN